MAVANWKTQYQLDVNSPYGVVDGAGWYDADANANATLDAEIVADGTGTQYVFTGWSGDASGTALTSDSISMDTPKTATANWKTQYYLTVSSTHGDTKGTGWYDKNTNAYANLSSATVPGTTGVQYVFTSWGDAASGATSTSNPILMNNAKTATANWKTQYQVSFAVGSGGGGTVAPSSAVWVDAGSGPATISASASSGYHFSLWTATAGITVENPQSSTTTATVTAPGTITATFAQNVVPEYPTPTALAALLLAASLLAILFKQTTTNKSPRPHLKST